MLDEFSSFHFLSYSIILIENAKNLPFFLSRRDAIFQKNPYFLPLHFTTSLVSSSVKILAEFKGVNF